MIITITREEAITALKEAIEKDNQKWIFFWTGYLLGLPDEPKP